MGSGDEPAKPILLYTFFLPSLPQAGEKTKKDPSECLFLASKKKLTLHMPNCHYFLQAADKWEVACSWIPRFSTTIDQCKSPLKIGSMSWSLHEIRSFHS